MIDKLISDITNRPGIYKFLDQNAKIIYIGKALNLKKRINDELINFDIKKLQIKAKNSKKITLLSGPYTSINLMKNDYIQLKNFGFEELDISINE